RCSCMSLIQDALDKAGNPTQPLKNPEGNSQPSRIFQKPSRPVRQARILFSKSFREKKIKQIQTLLAQNKEEAEPESSSRQPKTMNWIKALPFILFLIAAIMVSEFLSHRQTEEVHEMATSRTAFQFPKPHPAPAVVPKETQSEFKLTGITFQDG